MKCPPAQSCGQSLGILPSKIYPYYNEFYLLARLYYREKDFPQRVDKFYQTKLVNVYALTPEELKRVREAAVFMAETISKVATTRAMLFTMIEWKEIYGNPPVDESYHQKV